MARNKTSKMTVSFEAMDIIKNMAGDIAQEENRSISSVIEEIVLNGLLPYPSSVKWLILDCLYDDDGINKVLSSIYMMYGTGYNLDDMPGNMRPLAEYGLQQASISQTTIDDTDTSSIQYVCTQMRALINILQDVAAKAQDHDPIQSVTYQTDVKWATEITNELEKTPKFSKLSNFYQFLLNNWEVVADISITYRLLSMLVSMDRWDNNAHARLTLLTIIRRVILS